MATLVRWDPFREVAALQNEMGRLFGLMREGNGSAERSWVPALDVWETDEEIVYAFDLPGIEEDGISVEFEDGALTVTAQRERKQEVSDDRFYRFERRFGTFSRAIGLPQGVREGDISAKYAEGVLEVHVRKPEQVKPRRIQIGVGENATTIEGKASKAS
jgi:HSP20 family protein